MQPAGNQASIPLRKLQRLKGIITGKQLVAAIAAESDRHARSGEPAEHVSRKNGTVAHRLIELRQYVRNQIARLVKAENVVMMIAAEMLRDALCISRFVERLLMESDGKSPRLRSRDVARGERQYCAGIDPSAQKNSQRYIAYQPAFHRLRQQCAQLFTPDVFRIGRHPVKRFNPELPILRALDRPGGDVVAHPMSAGQLGNVLVQGVGSGNETVREVLTQRTVIDDPIDARMLKQGAQFRGETEKSVAHRVVKWFLAEAVPGEEQPAPRAVVDRECEHAVQPHGKTFAPLLVAVD